MALPFDREPADYLISVSTAAQLADLVDPDQTRLVVRDKRVAYVEDVKAFYAYDAQIPAWVAVTSPGGGAASIFAPVDTLVDLGSVDTGGAPNGSIIYVNAVDDIYALDLVGSYTPDGLTVIAAAGGGYWVSRFVGRWDDLQGSIANGAGAGLLTLEFYRDTRFNMYFMRHDQNDELNFVFQTSHRWKYDTDVYPHLHVVAMADPAVTQYVVIDGYYAWTRPNHTTQIPALAGWTTFSQTVPIEPGDIYTQKILSLGSITPPSWARESTSLLIYFRRYGTGPGDTYTTNKDHGTPAANLGLISSDVHYQANKAGSVLQIPT